MAIDLASGLPLDTAVTIELPLSAWRVVLDHLNRGIYRDVVDVVSAICTQGDPQLYAAIAKVKKFAEQVPASDGGSSGHNPSLH